MINGKKLNFPGGDDWQDELDNVPDHIREEAFKLIKQGAIVGKPVIYGTKGFNPNGFERMFYDPERYVFKNSDWGAKVEYPIPTNELLP